MASSSIKATMGDIYSHSPYNHELSNEQNPYQKISFYSQNPDDVQFELTPELGAVAIPRHWSEAKKIHCLSLSKHFENLAGAQFRLKAMTQNDINEMIDWIHAKERVAAKMSSPDDVHMVSKPPPFWAADDKDLSNFKFKVNKRFDVIHDGEGWRLRLKDGTKFGVVNVAREFFLPILYEIHLNEEKKFKLPHSKGFIPGCQHMGKDKMMAVLKCMDLDRYITRKMVESVSFGCCGTTRALHGGAIKGAISKRKRNAADEPAPLPAPALRQGAQGEPITPPQDVLRTFNTHFETFNTPLEMYDNPLEGFNTSVERLNTPFEMFDDPLEMFNTTMERLNTPQEGFETPLGMLETPPNEFDTPLDSCQFELTESDFNILFGNGAMDCSGFRG